jgi:hypothetical protein
VIGRGHRRSAPQPLLDLLLQRVEAPVHVIEAAVDPDELAGDLTEVTRETIGEPRVEKETESTPLRCYRRQP